LQTPAASTRRARAHIVREVDARAHAELPCARLTASRPHTCSESWVPAGLRTPPPGRQRALTPAGARRGPPSPPQGACGRLSVTPGFHPASRPNKHLAEQKRCPALCAPLVVGARDLHSSGKVLLIRGSAGLRGAQHQPAAARPCRPSVLLFSALHGQRPLDAERTAQRGTHCTPRTQRRGTGALRSELHKQCSVSWRGLPEFLPACAGRWCTLVFQTGCNAKQHCCIIAARRQHSAILLRPLSPVRRHHVFRKVQRQEPA